MNRRNLLKTITGITAAAGLEMNPTYVTAQDTVGVDVLILKCEQQFSQQQLTRFRDQWLQAMKGTALEHIKTVVLMPGMSVELIRHRQP